MYNNKYTDGNRMLSMIMEIAVSAIRANGKIYFEMLRFLFFATAFSLVTVQ
jgi:hypothetical protein